MSTSHVWIWYTTVGIILTVATVAAIRGGLTSRHALTAIRLAQQEVIAARSAHPEMTTPQALQDAEAMLSKAYEALAARRYEEAMAAASKARQLSNASLEPQTP
ncbi:MAG: hypothetical protein HYY58_02680 [Candidatus Omnitrophica bacterium]|nr:hypothetical protein [Candidatus Omnitrophota bacterium]